MSRRQYYTPEMMTRYALFHSHHTFVYAMIHKSEMPHEDAANIMILLLHGSRSLRTFTPAFTLLLLLSACREMDGYRDATFVTPTHTLVNTRAALRHYWLLRLPAIRWLRCGYCYQDVVDTPLLTSRATLMTATTLR